MLPAAGTLSRLQREVEAGFEAALRRTEIRLRSTYEHCKSEVREFPAQSVLIAAAGGYICHRLPIRSILATGARMFAAFTPPTLVALGIWKLAEYYTRRKAEDSRRTAPQEVSAPSAAPGLLVSDVL